MRGLLYFNSTFFLRWLEHLSVAWVISGFDSLQHHGGTEEGSRNGGDSGGGGRWEGPEELAGGGAVVHLSLRR